MDRITNYEMVVKERLLVDFDKYCETEGYEMNEIIVGFMEYCLEKPEKVKGKLSTKH